MSVAAQTMQTPAQIGDNQPPLKERLALSYEGLSAEVEAMAARANDAPKEIKDESDLDGVGVIVKDARALFRRADYERKKEKEPFLRDERAVDAFFKVFTDRLDRIASALEGRANAYQAAKREADRKAAEAARKAAEEEAHKAREAEAEARRKAAEAAEAERVKTAAKHEAKAEAAAERAAEADQRAAEAEQRAAAPPPVEKTRGASGTVAGAKVTQKVRISKLDALDLNKLKPYLDREAVQKAATAWLRVTKGTVTIDGLEVYEDTKATFR